MLESVNKHSDNEDKPRSEAIREVLKKGLEYDNLKAEKIILRIS